MRKDPGNKTCPQGSLHIRIAQENINLRVPTSGAGWNNWEAGSLLTKPHKLRTDDSATARHEHEAQAECEWYRSINRNLKGTGFSLSELL